VVGVADDVVIKGSEDCRAMKALARRVEAPPQARRRGSVVEVS